MDNRISDLVYIRHHANSDSSTSFCIGRFNSTHHFGCQNSLNPQGGLPYFMDGSKEFPISVPGKRKFVLLIDVQDYDTIIKLRNNLNTINESTVGVIFYRLPIMQPTPFERRFNSFSQDTECPNSYFGSYNHSATMWHCKYPYVSNVNPYFEFAFIKWPFPIFYIANLTLIEHLKRCNHIRERECLVELRSNMYGAINSKRCVNRNDAFLDSMTFRSTVYCSPIKADNLFATLIPIRINQTIAKRSIILITARLDSFTMFDSYSPSSRSVYTGVIVLIATAHLMANNFDKLSQKNDSNILYENVMFALFDGESVGYIGSSSWLFDLIFNNRTNMNQTEEEGFFLKLDSIAFVLELSQLLSSDTRHWLHWDKMTKSKTKNNKIIKSLLEMLKTENKFFHLKEGVSNQLPPSTARIFQTIDPNLPVAVLAGYDTEYSSQFHSLFDTTDPDEAERLTDKLGHIVGILTNFLILHLTGIKSDIQIDHEFIHNLTICLQIPNKVCHLFDRVHNLSQVPFDFTGAVQAPTLMNNLNWRMDRNEKIRNKILSILANTNIFNGNCNEPKPSYPHLYNHSEMDEIDGFQTMENQNGKCQYSQTWKDSFISYYFDNDMDPEPKKWLNSMRNKFQFSSLAESNYDSYREPSIWIYVRPTFEHEIIILFVGICITIISITITSILKRYSKKIFNPPIPKEVSKTKSRSKSPKNVTINTPTYLKTSTSN